MVYWAICTGFDHVNSKEKLKNGNDQKRDCIS